MRNSITRAWVAGILLGGWMPYATAQAYPTKPIRIVVGFSAGGGGDVTGRLIAQRLATQFGQPVIVENRVGAAGAIAHELVARAAPDGHTLLFAAGAFAALPALRSKLPYDTMRDFTPVGLAVVTAFALCVHPSVPARDVKSLVALAHTRRNTLSYSSPGVGSSAHLAGELFNMITQSRMMHVPFKGAPEAATAVASGEIDVGLPSVVAALPLLDAGKLRAIAVTSEQRSSMLPKIPALAEVGLPHYDRGGWNGMLAPAGTPREVVDLLNTSINRIVLSAEMREALGKIGFEPRTGTPEQFAEFIRREMIQNAKLLAIAGTTRGTATSSP